MFFSGLFAAFFTIRAHATVWPPPGTKLDTYQALVFTVRAARVEPDDAVRRLGTRARRAGQGAVLDRRQLPPRRGVPRQPDVRVEDAARSGRSTNAYGSLFYIMSGLHGLHVLLGLVAMIVLLIRMSGSEG